MGRRLRRLALVICLVPPVLLGLFVVVSTLWIEAAAWGRLYDDPAELPPHAVGLVLGTSSRLPSGEPNLFFEHRIEAAADLYHRGAVRHLLVSGDNRSPYYNEPRTMQRALRARGVPAEAMTLDYAGLRTLDSVVRAKAIFGQQQVIIITQEFHNKRAVFLANRLGLDAVGFNAAPVRLPRGLKTRIREFGARCKAVLDVTILRTGPRYLGDEEPIALEERP